MKTSADRIGRRSALRLIAGAPLALGFGLTAADTRMAHAHAEKALNAAAKGQPYEPGFFTPHEWQTVRFLADQILPRDERSGSATEAGVPEFMDFLMTDPALDERARETRQTAMRGGLAWIDAECRRRFGRDLVSCGAEQQRTFLDELASSKDDEDDDESSREPREQRSVRLRHGPAFFHSFRDLTASGFWSSRMGVEDLGYVGNTATVWEGPPPEVLRKLGLDT